MKMPMKILIEMDLRRKYGLNTLNLKHLLIRIAEAKEVDIGPLIGDQDGGDGNCLASICIQNLMNIECILHTGIL